MSDKLNKLEKHMQELQEQYAPDNVEMLNILAVITAVRISPEYDVLVKEDIDESTGETKKSYLRKINRNGTNSDQENVISADEFKRLEEAGHDVIKKVFLVMEYQEGQDTKKFQGYANLNNIDLPPKVDDVNKVIGHHFDVSISFYTKDDGKESVRIARATHRPDKDTEAKIRLAATYGAKFSIGDE